MTPGAARTATPRELARRRVRGAPRLLFAPEAPAANSLASVRRSDARARRLGTARADPLGRTVAARFAAADELVHVGDLARCGSRGCVSHRARRIALGRRVPRAAPRAGLGRQTVGAAPVRSTNKYSTFPAGPVIGGSTSSPATKPFAAAHVRILSTALRRTPSSLTTPPRPTCSRPTSNCGFPCVLFGFLG